MAKLRDKIARIAFGDVISRGIGFLTTIYLVRTLGVEAFGYVTMALSFLGYQIWFSDLGLLNIGAREVAKDPVKRTFRAKEIFLAKVALGVIVFLIGLLIIPTLDISDLHKTLFRGFSFSLIPYALLMEWYYNGSQKFGKVALSKITHSLIYLCLVYLMIKSAGDLESIPLYYTIGIASSALILGIFSYFEHPFKLTLRGWNVFKDLLKSASTIGMGWFFTQMIQLLPPLVIGFMLSEQDAGIYGAAIRIIFAAMIIDRIFVNLLLPNLSSQWIENKAAAKRNVQLVSRVMLTVASLLTIFIAISAPYLIELLYGSEFSESGAVLSVLSILLFATFMNSLFSFGLVAIGRDREFFKSTVAGGISTIVLVVSFSLTDQLILVTLGVALSEFIFVLSSYYWFKRFVDLRFIGSLLISISAGFLVYTLSLYTEFHILLEATLGMLILGILLYVMRIYTGEHVSWLKQNMS